MTFTQSSKLLMLCGFLSLSASAAEVNSNIKDVDYCTVCHGSELVGNPSTGAPRLSGMDPWYAKRQLENFQQGLRGFHPEDLSGNEMRGAVEHLPPKLVDDALELIANSQSAIHPTYTADQASAGKQVYASCATCHGADAKGNEQLGAPSLLVQSDWYLARQLAYFRDGKRGAEGSDSYAVSMKAAAQALTDDQIEQLVSYLSQLQLASATKGK